ncbi:phosphoribosylaminoimidazole-succinocarboxamide synthase [Leuconostoc litchii]|uniref:Phosphoribosylaminoimidazole-succinocarboxamide synthase n=1 Tax=Leuconostoc litchii TaxID=1981069 RepID=A0A6P2CSH3_9LACO|nr:phosphoribosylaminoimidazolesuccinocarboxamide synthase [Leuconostoc litchii]TYC47217.1 phosphoribosylaminoimidazolesuccinocarboxamide synthase [Leuconostoc litchii]GMA69195.1 phosphoribosylaminoimidazole-succinocarboxamide synthase [Leuconostoc litchii]
MSSTVEYDNQVVTRGDLKYQGKAKQVYLTNNSEILWVHYMDQATALNGKVHEDIPEKGRLNSAISHILFQYLTRHGIENHYLTAISETDELDLALDIIPIEVVTRNYASGHFVSKFDATSMQKLNPIVQEFYYKSDALDDPFMNDSQILALGYATEIELEKLRNYAQKVNQLLKSLFDEIKINLIDFKLEFGKNALGELILADELSPDNMRLVDQKTGKSLDKDVFRQHSGDVTIGYRDVLSRLENLEK